MRVLLIALLAAISYAQTENAQSATNANDLYDIGQSVGSVVHTMVAKKASYQGNLLPTACEDMHMGECLMSSMRCEWFLDEGEGECIDKPGAAAAGGEGGEGLVEGVEAGEAPKNKGKEGKGKKVKCEDVLELDCPRTPGCKWFIEEGEGECVDAPPGDPSQIPLDTGAGGALTDNPNGVQNGNTVTFNSFEELRNFGRTEFETERWGNLPLMYETGAQWVAFYEAGDEAVEHTPVQGWAYFLRLVAQGSLRGMTMPLTVTKEPFGGKPGFSMELLRCEDCVIKLQANFYRMNSASKKIEMEYSYYQDEDPPTLSLRQQQPSQNPGIWDAYLEALKSKNVQAIIGFYSQTVKIYYYSGDTGSYNVHDGYPGAEAFLNGIVQPSPLDDMIVEYQSVEWRPSGSAFFVWAASRDGANFVRGVNYLQLDENGKIDDHVIIATAGNTDAAGSGSSTNTGSTTYSNGVISGSSSSMTTVTNPDGSTSVTTSGSNSWGPPTTNGGSQLKLQKMHSAIDKSIVDYRILFITSFCFVLGFSVVIFFTRNTKLAENDMAQRMI